MNIRRMKRSPFQYCAEQLVASTATAQSGSLLILLLPSLLSANMQPEPQTGCTSMDLIPPGYCMHSMQRPSTTTAGLHRQITLVDPESKMR